MSDEIQVCEGWWRQRCGNVVRIAGESNDSYYPWQCVTGRTYRKDGRFRSHSETEEDLVEFLSVDDPTRKPAMNDRREMVRQFAVAILQGDSATPVATSARLSPSTIWSMAEQMADSEPQGG